LHNYYRGNNYCIIFIEVLTIVYRELISVSAFTRKGIQRLPRVVVITICIFCGDGYQLLLDQLGDNSPVDRLFLGYETGYVLVLGLVHCLVNRYLFCKVALTRFGFDKGFVYKDALLVCFVVCSGV